MERHLLAREVVDYVAGRLENSDAEALEAVAAIDPKVESEVRAAERLRDRIHQRFRAAYRH